MEVHELGDLLDDLLRVPQRAQTLAGHLRADHLVVVEAHAAALDEPAGGRLADVVEQRREPQHEVRLRARLLEVDRLVEHDEGVLVDVLVLVVLVDLQPHGRHLRQHVVGEAGVDHQLEPPARVHAAQQLGQLDLDPLRGDPVDLAVHVVDRGEHAGRRGEAELAHEPDRAHHPQRVVGERLLRGRRRVEHLATQRVPAVVRVDELLRRQVDGHRVDREVAPDQVFFDRAAEADLGVAALPVVGVGPEGGDLHGRAALGRAHRAERDPGVPDRVGPAGQQLAHAFGPCVGREVEVVAEAVEQRVPHGPADEIELVPGLGEPGGELVGHRETHRFLLSGGGDIEGVAIGHEKRA